MRIGFIGDSLTAGKPGSAYIARLRRAMPEHTLVNLGVGGDTVSSLLTRIRRRPMQEHLDIAFLWVGVNDIVETEAMPVRLICALRAQRPAVDLTTFREDYVRTLEVLAARASSVVAVSPLLKGERADGVLNRRLGQIRDIIREAAAMRGDVSYCDLYDEMMAALDRSPGPDYVRAIPWRIVWDILTARSDAIIDRRSSGRGYHYTLDGLHLNSRGADWVAERFLREIRNRPG